MKNKVKKLEVVKSKSKETTVKKLKKNHRQQFNNIRNNINSAMNSNSNNINCPDSNPKNNQKVINKNIKNADNKVFKMKNDYYDYTTDKYDDDIDDDNDADDDEDSETTSTGSTKQTKLVYDVANGKQEIDSTEDQIYAFLRVDNQHYYLNSNNKVKRNESPEIDEATGLRPKRKIQLSICLAHTRYKLIGQVAKSLGWKIVREAMPWNILWADSVPGIEVYKEMKRFQKVNHFPGMVEICRKDLLARNLGRMLKLFPHDYNIFPKTWCFPADLGDAINYSKEHRHKTFILKPDQGAQGRGIWLTKNLKDTVKPTERLICQVYISRPLLIDGYKFDLRIYTLVTTVDPLRIFVYNEGLVRFATNKYQEPNDSNTSNLYMHLTNYSVNKHSEEFRRDRQHDGRGSKRKLSSLNCSLYNAGLNINELWNNIDDTIIKTILSSWPMLKHNYRACFPSHDVLQACFEILGFDILVDSNLKPYLLEVNHSPSFHTDEQIDKEVKESLIRDTLNLLNISLVDKRKIISEDKRRIKMRLLKKIKKIATAREPTMSSENIKASKKLNGVSPLGQQIAWEESHLGGFRRIMPTRLEDQLRYTQFFHLQNQASIYNDTAASKRREEAGKEMRNALIERERKNLALKIAATRSTAINTKRLNSQIEQNRKHNHHLEFLKKKEWTAGSLSHHDYDERERISALTARDNLIRTKKVVEMVFEQFFEFNLLSDTDCRKYTDLFQTLKNRESQLTENGIKYDQYERIIGKSDYAKVVNYYDFTDQQLIPTKHFNLSNNQ